MAVEFITGFCNIVIGSVNLTIGSRLGDFSVGNLIIGGFLVGLGLLFLVDSGTTFLPQKI